MSGCLEELVGAGVYYGAAVTEAPTTRGKEVFVVGGGNSAGQAAVHLSSFAARVTVLVRGDSLAESMSDYLVNEMKVIPNISIEFGCQIVDGVEAVGWSGLRSKVELAVARAALMLPRSSS